MRSWIEVIVACCLPVCMVCAAAEEEHGVDPAPEVKPVGPLAQRDHPRPDWARPWVDLNGPWRFDFDPQDVGVKEEWFRSHAFGRTIRVPYPWQSPLSGVHDVEYQGAAWYERDVQVPEDLPGSRFFLVFGAVDWSAIVWVDGQKLAEHEGGYTPFEVELTDVARRGDTVRVTVRAFDVTDPETPSGKQTGWYTRTGGIWQTVYLEGRGDSYFEQAHISPDVDAGRAKVRCRVRAAKAGRYRIRITASVESNDETAQRRASHTVERAQWLDAGEQTVESELDISEPMLWSPENPTLYDVELGLYTEGTDGNQERVPQDTVHSYFGMRKVSRGTYGDSAHEYILLNNGPIFLRGALHQSFNPEGIYTHPNDDYLRRDYKKAKSLGLNFLRIHIKVDEPRALYWADRLGVMLMCDMPNFQRKTDRAKALWEQTLRTAIARDFNHPSIIAWCNFNETWGIGDGGYDRPTQEWVRDMYLLDKRLDPTRLVEDNSACNHDHVETDINSWHFYINDFEQARDHIAQVVEQTYPGSTFNYAEGWRQDTAPLLNSEYGGVSAGSGDRDISWVFLFLTNLLRKHDKICGYVYTELEDIEWEHNGFMNYDRSDKVYNYPAGITVADLQRDEFVVLDGPPYQKLSPGTHLSIPILLSHWSERENLSLRLSVDGQTIDFKPWSDWIQPVERTVVAKPYAVTPQGPFEFDVPDAAGLMNVVAEVLVDGQRYAANYCVVDVRGGAAWNGQEQYVVSFPVESFSVYGFGGVDFFLPEHPGKIFGTGAGFIEYALRLPSDLSGNAVLGCELVVEVGAKADAERLDWPAVRKASDCPQTDGRAWPTDVYAGLTGVSDRLPLRVETDFADAEGVLSHVAQFQQGSHGKVFRVPLSTDMLAHIRNALNTSRTVTLRFEVPENTEHVGGLALYGAQMGCYAADPALVFTLRPGTPQPHGASGPTGSGSRLRYLIETGGRGHRWRYTEEKPKAGWNEPGFDDSAWQEGMSGFGQEGTPGARIGTPWLTPDIWLRTSIELPADFAGKPVFILVHHDEDIEIYVNGSVILEKRGFVTRYERSTLSEKQLNAFRPAGANVVAVHCHQTVGGQFVDVGLATVE